MKKYTILHLSKEENDDDDDLPYPKFRNFKQMAAQIIKKHEEHAFPSSSSQIESTQSYQPPHDSIMGPPVYPPAQQNPQPFYRPDYQFGYPQGKSKIFSGGYGEYYNSQWTLPPAWTESGVMLVLPSDPGLWSEVISRWESITLNRLNNQTWSDNKAKLAFVENLLGESEKLMWQQWRTAYPNAYAALEAIADEPQNITSQIRQLILSAVYQELDLDDNWDIVSADFDDSSVYSISEGEGDTHQSISVMVQDTPVEETVFMAIEEFESDDDLEEEDNQFGHHAFMFHPGPPTKIAEMVQSVGSWKPNKELPVKKISLTKQLMSKENKQPQKTDEARRTSIQPVNEVNLLKELLKEKTEQVQQMIRDQAKEYYENQAAMQKKEEIWQSKESSLVRDISDALKIIDQLRIEKEGLDEQKDEEISKTTAQLPKKE
ncbi:hypothetical protein Tco_0750563 [Tanacetum coccineum]|uniref:Uncharacterized protein n=1 Tax=Tanacetum coccineum TaxID=301880 RepID=A0ABQ4Z4D2_9ASTR